MPEEHVRRGGRDQDESPSFGETSACSSAFSAALLPCSLVLFAFRVDAPFLDGRAGRDPLVGRVDIRISRRLLRTFSACNCVPTIDTVRIDLPSAGSSRGCFFHGGAELPRRLRVHLVFNRFTATPHAFLIAFGVLAPWR